MDSMLEKCDWAKDIISVSLGKLSDKRGLKYADVRFEASEGKIAAAIAGTPRSAEEDYGLSMGIRVLAEVKGVIAPGYLGKSFGGDELTGLREMMPPLYEAAFRRAKRNAELKAKFMKKYKALGKSMHSTPLAETPIFQDRVSAKYKKSPYDVDLEEFSRRITRASAEVQKAKGVASNTLAAVTGFSRKVFASTEGAVIDQAKAITEGFFFIAAKGKAMESYYDHLGELHGLETFDGENFHNMNLEDWTAFITKGTIELSNAPAIKEEKDAVVVTDPWYNALLSHEITGHPSEADRALKKEAAWAGRAWWFTSLEKNKLGQEVASEEVTVFSDPTIDGYGYYKYDDEGVKAKRVLNIKEGVLNEFLNSRETAAVLGVEPNGGMRATSAENVPLVRMNNTCFGAGTWKKDEMIGDVKNGYYVVGQKTPSIGETRQNFRITCWKIYKIEKGEIGQLYRQGGLTADSHTFLKNINAVADDFKIYNIPNCGKGTPMQVMKVGNGGPHIRGIATITGVNGAAEGGSK